MEISPLWKLFTAVSLDIIFGDPHFLPHPVKFIGSYIYFCEIRMRKIFPAHELFAGFICGATTVIFTSSFVMITIIIASRFGSVYRDLTEIYWIYAGLSAGDLQRSVESVYNSLIKNDLPLARKKLSMIVGRDTEKLDEGEISRAAVETTAESFVDGILSPLFFFMIGGAPLMWAYKAVNTCDSMIGHNDERYRLFGRFSARLDDIANFAPARISLLAIFAGAFLMRLLEGANFSPFASLKVGLRDMRKHASPNAGVPEAAFAGALSVRLGGLNYYSGDPYNSPIINPCGSECKPKDINNGLKLLWASYLISLSFCFIILSFYYL